MDTGAAGGVLAGDDLSSSASSPAAAISRWTFAISRRYQHLLDKSVPHILYRWIGCLAVIFIYALRVYLVQGFYIITYGLGIYMLNLLMGFLSPQVDPETLDGPTLPTRGSDEFRPFVRRLPEFKFWFVHCSDLITFTNQRNLCFLPLLCGVCVSKCLLDWGLICRSRFMLVFFFRNCLKIRNYRRSKSSISITIS